MKQLRWWPLVLILAIGGAGIAFTLAKTEWVYEQQRSMRLLGFSVGTYLALLIWWLAFSRASRRAKFIGLGVALLPAALFRHRGMSGDFIPIFEFRFTKSAAPLAAGASLAGDTATRADFPQLLGPNRDGRLAGPALNPDWNAHPPQLIWKRTVGAAWCGFAIAGNRAVTMEQDGENECVTCYELTTGKPLWRSASPGHYSSGIAGEGPRATPTIAGDYVFTLGANGTFRCLDLTTGNQRWQVDIMAESSAKLPDWGFSSSPLIVGENVIVSAGGANGKSLLAYNQKSGKLAWSAGDRPASYSSPFLRTLAGREQLLMFNSEAITAHDPATGAVLWDHAWGKGMPHVAAPIVTGGDRVLFSSGYGVGSKLLAIAPGTDGKFTASELWKTIRFQAKFSNPVERDGYVYGMSDGFFACLDLRDGTVKWKSGRYGHGQCLLIGEHLLQITEDPGDLVLLRPTPEAANELARIHVFDSKTWNPPALSGDLLLLRNDTEAACLRLPLKKAG